MIVTDPRHCPGEPVSPAIVVVGPLVALLVFAVPGWLEPDSGPG